MGAITPIGTGREAFWNAMMEGKNGGWELLNRIAKFTMSRIGTK